MLVSRKKIAQKLHGSDRFQIRAGSGEFRDREFDPKAKLNQCYLAGPVENKDSKSTTHAREVNPALRK